MESPSLPLYQPSSSDVHISLPPTVYIPRENRSFPVPGDDLSPPPSTPITHAGLPWNDMEEAAEAASRLGTRRRRLDDLEMGQGIGSPQTASRRSVACVFCLVSRDVCMRLGMNAVPVLFNTFGEGKFDSSLVLIRGVRGR